jgi:hypothetical protein
MQGVFEGRAHAQEICARKETNFAKNWELARSGTLLLVAPGPLDC